MAWDRYPDRKWAGQPAEFWVGLVGFAVAIFVVTGVLAATALQPLARFAIAVVPLAPLLLMARGFVRMLRHQDELYKRIQCEAVSYAAGIVVVLSLLVGFLEDQSVVPHINSMWAGQVLVFAWGIAGAILAHRYR